MLQRRATQQQLGSVIGGRPCTVHNRLVAANRVVAARRSGATACRQRGRIVTKAVFQADSGAWVVPPRSGPARGIVHFIGGAFAGAAPHLIYPLFLQLLADAGYTVVATPFAVTFQHEDCARAVRKMFVDTLAQLRTLDAVSSEAIRDSSLPLRETVSVGSASSSTSSTRSSSPLGSTIRDFDGRTAVTTTSPRASSSTVVGGSATATALAGTPTNLSAAMLAPEGIPVFGVGHSNGALLHLLIGSYFPGASSSNVIISFNNKQVSEAIPIPGLLGRLSPSVKMARNFPLSLPMTFPSPSQLLSSAASALAPVLSEDQRIQLAKSGLALEQLNMVFGEVGDGVTDFVPTPAESRAIISASYSVYPTLMVRFIDDSIDETPSTAALLRSQNPAGVTVLTLPGSHITPCGGEVPWQAGQTFTALDALAQALRTVSQVDVRRLGRQVVGWLDSVR